mmetsp:Transcript_14244/g.20847  ORF Transcript_14244/g.20847 Transcript_14244/m.20847 type:complete len:346 (+) Transcript_14244:206-1243(+)
MRRVTEQMQEKNYQNRESHVFSRGCRRSAGSSGRKNEREHSKRGNRSARGPRQDHHRGRTAALRVYKVCRERRERRERPGDGLRRPGERARHHHHLQGHAAGLQERHDHQRGGHAGPRRLCRGGGPRAHHDRRRLSRGGRRGGRHGPDQVRALQSAQDGPQARPRPQQVRQARRLGQDRDWGSRERALRDLPLSRRRRSPDGLRHRLRLWEGGLGHHRPRARPPVLLRPERTRQADSFHGRAARYHHSKYPAPRPFHLPRHPRSHARTLCHGSHHRRLRQLPRKIVHRPHLFRHRCQKRYRRTHPQRHGSAKHSRRSALCQHDLCHVCQPRCLANALGPAHCKSR